MRQCSGCPESQNVYEKNAERSYQQSQLCALQWRQQVCNLKIQNGILLKKFESFKLNMLFGTWVFAGIV